MREEVPCDSTDGSIPCVVRTGQDGWSCYDF